MKSTQAALFALAILAGAATGAQAKTETLREQSDRTDEAAGISGLEVENSRGLIEVRPSPDGRIHVRALKMVRVGDRAKAEELSRQIKVAVHRQGGRYLVKVTYPQRQEVRIGFWDLMSGEVELPRTEVRLSLQVPATLPVKLRSTSGDLFSESLRGPQTLETTSGDADIRDSRGPVTFSSTSGELSGDFGGRAHVRTVSGDIQLEGVNGPLDAHSISGEIVVRDAADSLRLGTVSGDIEVARALKGVGAGSTSGSIRVRGVQGRCELESTSGDLDARLGRGLLGASLSSGSGDIEVRIDSGLGVALEVRTSNGTIDASIPLEVKSVTRRMLTGRIGPGGVPVQLKSSSGDILIMSGGD